MRKSGWAAAAGLASAVLLLTACGSSSSSPAAAATGVTQTSAPAPASSSTGQASTSAPSSSSATTAAPSTSSPASTPTSQSPQPQASGGGTIPRGTTTFIDQMSKLGFVLALANGQVVYTFAHDPAGGTPTCTGACASVWVPVTGIPKAAPGLTLPGTFALVTRSDGTKQITYNGHPLYTFKGARPLSTAGEGVDGVWHVVKLPAP